MSFAQKISRFSRKTPEERWVATRATLRSLAPLQAMSFVFGFWQRVRRSLMHEAAASIPSGVGDSADLLYGLVRSMKPEVCVEIGSARGKSACHIGMALKENGRGRLYAIDPHQLTTWNDIDAVDTLETFRSNISALDLSEQVVMVRSTSEEAARKWDRRIDLIFIDGDHSYEGVKRDWELFLPYIKPFGIVIFHDTIWDLTPDHPLALARPDMGVPRFVEELRQLGYPVLTIDRDCGVSMVQPKIGGQPLRRRSPGGSCGTGQLAELH